MKFDKSRVYTALNAAELKIGSKVIVADNLDALIDKVTSGRCVETLKDISEPTMAFRFIIADTRYNLAYLVSKPEEKRKLKWTDLKPGDIIINNNADGIITCIVTRIDTRGHYHIYAGDIWISDKELAEEWEKIG